MRYECYVEIACSTDVMSLSGKLLRTREELGFELLNAYLLVDAPSSAPFTEQVCNNTPVDWVPQSLDAERGRQDPVMQRLKRSGVPFAYDQAFYIRANRAELWEEQAPFGFQTGLATCLHLPRHRHFLFGVDRRDALPTNEEDLGRLLEIVQMLAVCAYESYSGFAPEAHNKPWPRLTPRELEVLRWTAEGKSAWSVGEILSISESTVNFYLQNVLQKFKCSSKHQAVIKAMASELL